MSMIWIAATGAILGAGQKHKSTLHRAIGNYWLREAANADASREPEVPVDATVALQLNAPDFF